MIPEGSQDSEPPTLLKDIPRMNLCHDEVFSLLLPQKEKGYRISRKQMKIKYYKLETHYGRKCEEVRMNFSSTSSRELDLMSSSLQNWREALITHKREHYSECSQLILKHATEFDNFVVKYHTSQFKFSLDDSRDLQHVCRNTYLDLYDGSIDPEILSEAFWTLIESWDSIRVAVFTNGQTLSDFNQLPNTSDEPRSTTTVKVLEEVPGTSESSVNDSLSETPLELEGSALTLPETPKECVPERFMSILGSADAQIRTSSLLSEVEEERRICNSVVSIHARGEDISSPDTISTALELPDSVPNSSPIPIARNTPKSNPSAIPVKHDSPQVVYEAEKRDSTSESRNSIDSFPNTSELIEAGLPFYTSGTPKEHPEFPNGQRAVQSSKC